jgi:hypothetical protein
MVDTTLVPTHLATAATTTTTTDESITKRITSIVFVMAIVVVVTSAWVEGDGDTISSHGCKSKAAEIDRREEEEEQCKQTAAVETTSFSFHNVIYLVCMCTVMSVYERK